MMAPKHYLWNDGRELSVDELVPQLAIYRSRRASTGLRFDEGQAEILLALLQPVLQDVDLSPEERATTAMRISEALGAEIRLVVTPDGTSVEFLSEIASGRADVTG